MHKLSPALASVAMLAAACAERAPVFVEERILAMGTWVDVTLEAPSEGRARATIAAVETMLGSYQRDFHAWAPDGELARVNAALGRGQAVTTSAELAALIERARELGGRSGGLFEPGIGALIELWGFHSAAATPAQPPDAAAIADILAGEPMIDLLEIDGTQLSTRSRTLQLDLGGIAKGAAVDRIIEMMRAQRIPAALVNAGGDLRVLGNRGERRWRIGIRDPRSDELLGSISLRDGEAAFTSGDYERYFELGGRRFHHVLDPTTGYPVTHTLSVTVIAEDGATADAAATALLVAGPGRWRSIARSLGVELVLLIDSEGRIESTPAMSQRLKAAAPLI